MAASDDERLTESREEEGHAARMPKASRDPEKAEYLVRVKRTKTVVEAKAVKEKEKGFFGNQNTVARPRTPKWDHTVERLKKEFGVD